MSEETINGKHLLLTKEVAMVLRVTTRYVQAMVRNGELPRPILKGRHRAIDVRRFIYAESEK